MVEPTDNFALFTCNFFLLNDNFARKPGLAVVKVDLLGCVAVLAKVAIKGRGELSPGRLTRYTTHSTGYYTGRQKELKTSALHFHNGHETWLEGWARRGLSMADSFNARRSKSQFYVLLIQSFLQRYTLVLIKFVLADNYHNGSDVMN